MIRIEYHTVCIIKVIVRVGQVLAKLKQPPLISNKQHTNCAIYKTKKKKKILVIIYGLPVHNVHALAFSYQYNNKDKKGLLLFGICSLSVQI